VLALVATFHLHDRIAEAPSLLLMLPNAVAEANGATVVGVRKEETVRWRVVVVVVLMVHVLH